MGRSKGCSGSSSQQSDSTQANSDDKEQLFLSSLEEAVTNGGTKSLWKKYGNPITMQFKDRNLEAKVKKGIYRLQASCMATVVKV